MRTEYALNPILVDNPAPRFSWENSAPQLSYRVFVSSAALSWDSGVVASNATSQVAYAGPPLSSDTTYSVTVATETAAGWANSSAGAAFGTGLLTPAAWAGAAWVGGFNQLRGSFSLPAGAVSRARAYVTGVGCAELWVNGARVSNDTQGRETFFNPGFSTIFSTRLLYNAFDVTPLLQPGGENVVGIRLGQCKYGYLGEFCVGGEAACNRGIVVVTVDGAPVFTSGPAWVGAQSSILASHFYNGELVDGAAAAAEAGWSAPPFNAAGWAPAVVMPPPTAALSAHALPAIAGWEAPLSPVSVAAVPGRPGAFVFDLLNNSAGFCAATLAGPTPPGVRVVFTMAEIYNQSGSGDVRVQFACPAACCLDGGNCADQAFTYVTRGVPAGGVEGFRPTFAYSGFRYVRVENWPPGAPPPTPAALSCVRTASAVEDAGSVFFNASAPGGAALNAIQALIIRTQRSNLHSIPTDCPHREKRGWMADAGVTAPEAAFNFNMASFYENWLRTHADTSDVGCGPLEKNWTCPKWNKNQPGAGGGAASSSALDALGAAAPGEDVPNCYICCAGRPGFGCVPRTPTDFAGSVADVIPFDKNGYGAMPGSITWMSTSFIVAGVLLDTYNAAQFLATIYPQLCAHMDFYARNAEPATGLVGWDQYGDWNAVVPSNGLFIGNTLYLADNLVMASIAGALGKPHDAGAFLARAAALRGALRAAYFNRTSGVWDSGSQTAQAMALVFNLDPPSAPAVLAHLAADVAARGNHISGGVFGSRYLLQALSMHGRGDVALALATVPTAPSWLAMAVGTPEQPPLGTLWESWDGPVASGSSGNHPFLGGGAGLWMYSYALGLRFAHRAGGAGGEAGAGAARARCLLTVGLGTDLAATHGLDEAGACALARAVEGVRADAAAGTAPGALLAWGSLRRRFAAAAGGGGAAPAARLRPTGALVLDAALLAALGSASGALDTPRGRLAAAWAWGAAEGLTARLSVPPLDAFDVFVPVELLAGGAEVEVAAAGGGGGGGGAPAAWRAEIGGALGGRLPAGGAGVRGASWAAAGEAEQLVLAPAGAPAHLRLSLEPGSWTLRVRARGGEGGE